MAPPLRPAMPPGLPGVISPPGTIITPNGYPGQQSGPSIYNNPSSQQQQQQQFNGIAINRPYTNEGSGECVNSFYLSLSSLLKPPSNKIIVFWTTFPTQRMNMLPFQNA